MIRKISIVLLGILFCATLGISQENADSEPDLSNEPLRTTEAIDQTESIPASNISEDENSAPPKKQIGLIIKPSLGYISFIFDRNINPGTINDILQQQKILGSSEEFRNHIPTFTSSVLVGKQLNLDEKLQKQHSLQIYAGYHLNFIKIIAQQWELGVGFTFIKEKVEWCLMGGLGINLYSFRFGFEPDEAKELKIRGIGLGGNVLGLVCKPLKKDFLYLNFGLGFRISLNFKPSLYVPAEEEAQALSSFPDTILWETIPYTHVGVEIRL